MYTCQVIFTFIGVGITIAFKIKIFVCGIGRDGGWKIFQRGTSAGNQSAVQGEQMRVYENNTVYGGWKRKWTVDSGQSPGDRPGRVMPYFFISPWKLVRWMPV